MQLGEGACWRHDSACTQAAAGCMSERGRIVREKGRGRSLALYSGRSGLPCVCEGGPIRVEGAVRNLLSPPCMSYFGGFIRFRLNGRLMPSSTCNPKSFGWCIYSRLRGFTRHLPATAVAFIPSWSRSLRRKMKDLDNCPPPKFMAGQRVNLCLLGRGEDYNGGCRCRPR